MIKSARLWYMTFVRKNDAEGLKEWLKRAVNALAAHTWSKASACLNMLADELSELTIDQGFLQGFIDYYNEHNHGDEAHAHAPHEVGCPDRRCHLAAQGPIGVRHALPLSEAAGQLKAECEVRVVLRHMCRWQSCSCGGGGRYKIRSKILFPSAPT